MYYRKSEDNRRLKKLYAAGGYSYFKEDEKRNIYWYRYSPKKPGYMKKDKRLGAKHVRQAKFKVDFPKKGNYYRNFKINFLWEIW